MARIHSVRVEAVRVSHAEAVLLVRVELDDAPAVEVRGRLVGPRCTGVTTVEVAYPLRPDAVGDTSGTTLRAVIPEPNLWEPTAPFHYDGRVEAWANGARVDVRDFAVELRRT